MAETSKNNIYYNDDENSKADILADMKKMAESTDKAIENSKYNDTQIKKDISNMKTEITAKDNAQDNKILKLQTEKAELEKELKEAQEDFYQASVRGQASGEYIHVEDSSNCRARIGISGNSEQETRSGKNYLNTLAKYKAGEKVTVDGITYIFNEDGSITCNGTATADSVLTFSSNLQTINGSGKKIVGMITGTQVPAKLSILAYTSDWSKNTFELLSSVNKNITINMQENIDYTIFRIIAYKGTTLNNQTIYYQILDTSVNDLTYEQYGVSPSPDYQSPVKTVGSNVNYYNKETEKIGFVLSDGSLQPNNTVWTHSDFIEVNSNEIISITCENKANGQFAIVEYDKNKKFLKHNMCNYVNTEPNNKFTITTTSTTKYVIGAYRNDSNMNNIMIVKGSKVLPYNPNCNGQGSVKVTKCNKNLFDENNKLMNTTINSNEIIATGQDNYLFYFPVEYGHKYIFSTDFSESLTTNIVFGYCSEIPSIGVLSTYNVISLSNLKNKIFTPINEQNKYLCIRLNYKTQYNKMSNIQLEENTVSTSYEEHQEQSYIMPVQKEMLEGDYVADVEHHEWKKLTLTGNENIKLNTAFANVFNIEIPKINIMNQQVCLCNIAKGVIYNTALLTIQDNIIMTASLNKIVYKSTKFSSLSEFKTYLQNQYEEGTPVIVYYKLAEPINLELTDEQKAVAKELSNARTYKNVTNITTDSIAILDLDYAKDLETLLTSKESEV